jgi:hypothetical protein
MLATLTRHTGRTRHMTIPVEEIDPNVWIRKILGSKGAGFAVGARGRRFALDIVPTSRRDRWLARLPKIGLLVALSVILSVSATLVARRIQSEVAEEPTSGS